MFLKKISFLLIMMSFLLSCSRLTVNGLEPEKSDIQEINLSEINLWGKNTNLIKLSTQKELEVFSENINYTYYVKPGDKISVKNSDTDEVSEILTVRSDGKINVNKIGLISVIDKTSVEIEELVNAEGKKYYANAKYMVEIVEYNNNKIYIWGDIKLPGVLKFNGRTNLVEVVSLAGGLKLNSDDTETKALTIYCGVVRKSKKTVWIELNPLILEGKLEYNLNLVSGDIVYISTKKME